MGHSRLELQENLEELLGSDKVYYQPPEGAKLSYPCIVYNFDDDRVFYADNKAFNRTKRYLVTFMSRNPDDPVSDRLAELTYSAFIRRFASDNLYHDIFNLYH